MSPKATLHFVCGKLASGKTTFAQRLAKEVKAVFLSEDKWLAVLFPDQIKDFEDYLDCSSRFRAAIAPLVQALLGMGVSIVFDFGGNVPKERAWVKSLCQDAKIPLVLTISGLLMSYAKSSCGNGTMSEYFLPAIPLRTSLIKFRNTSILLDRMKDTSSKSMTLISYRRLASHGY